MAKKWLLKSEPNTYSIDDFQKDKVTYWDGVRNYQARNFLQAMEVGDEFLFYHSNAKPPAVVGLGKVKKKAYPDPSQFEHRSKYFDEKASKEKPRWFCPDVKFVGKFKRELPLEELREDKSLKQMVLLKKGSRLSVQPVTEKEFKRIIQLSQK